MMRISSSSNVNSAYTSVGSKGGERYSMASETLLRNASEFARSDGLQGSLITEAVDKYVLKNRRVCKGMLQKSLIVILLVSNSLWLMHFSFGQDKATSVPKRATHTTQNLWNISRTDMAWDYRHGIEGLERGRPLVIAHRGSSGVLPEHTAQAYKAAVDSGADVIECDAGLSSDNHVVCMHESWMNASTDVASKFPASRARDYLVDGHVKRNFFSVDFSLAELRSLRKVESKWFRNQQFNGLFQIATLKQLLQIAFESNRSIGVHVELKDPDFYNEHITTQNVTFEELVVKEMLDNGCQDKSDFRCFVQSFSLQSLQTAKKLTKLPLVYLTEDSSSLRNHELDGMATWLYGIGPWKDQIVNENGTTDLIERCHERGLKVHAYTFRNEQMYLASSYATDAYLEMARFFSLHLDAFFTDFPHTAHSFFTAIYAFHQ